MGLISVNLFYRDLNLSPQLTLHGLMTHKAKLPLLEQGLSELILKMPPLQLLQGL
jgi:hypothetical protein